MTPEEVVAQFLGTNKEIEAAQERGSQAVRRRAASGRPNMGYGDLIAREERLRSARDDNTSRLALVEKYIKDREVGERLRRSMAVQEAPNTPALSPQEVVALRQYEARRREARPKPTSALDIIREELPKFFRDNQELSDEVGDLSLKEGILGTGGAVLGTALPVAFGSGALGALSGAGMSIAGDAILDPAARKVLGTSIQDPLSSGTFGAMAGATGKLALPLTAAVAMSSGDAEAGAIHKLLQKFYHGANGPLQRGAIDSLEVTPQRSVAQHYAERRTRQRGGEPTVHEIMTDPFAGKKHGLGVSGGNVTQARRLSEQDRPVRIKVDGEWEEFAGGGLVSKGLKMLFPNAAAPMHVVKPKGGNWLTGSVEGALSSLKKPTAGFDLTPEMIKEHREILSEQI